MTHDSQARRNLRVIQQVSQLPSGCKACQRTGLPIYPLRVAAVPKTLGGSAWQPSVPPQTVALTGGEYKYALRTLREGYLYVLLDSEVWQAYEVTSKGYLRQFNPFVMPEAERVEPLSEQCVTYGHEIAASFINIDDTQYREAWLAFSSDPWSAEVLAAYASGPHRPARFTHINLAALKQQPATVPQARVLDTGLSVLMGEVAEFVAPDYPNLEQLPGEPLGGAHGFYSRQSQRLALADWVWQQSQSFHCPISALVLEDPVGMVQELNTGRMQLVEARQHYNETPEIRHKYLIASAIEQALAAMKQAITDASQPRHQPSASGYPASAHVTVPKEQVAQEAWQAQMSRLQRYYREEDRAAFLRNHHWILGEYQRRIAAIGQDLAACYRSPGWLAAITHDYAPETSMAGWAAQLATLAACLQGGSTDPETESVWQQWLEEASSAAWRGLLGHQASVLEAVYAGMGGYTNLKVVLSAKEIGDYLESEGIRLAINHRLLAISGAVTRLGANLSQPALEGYSRVVQGMIYLLTQQQVTLFTLTMSLGEYQQLNRELARVQLTTSGLPRFGGVLNEGQQVTHALTAGGGTQVTDPALLARRVTVTLVSDMEPAAFADALRRAGSSEGALQQYGPLTESQQMRHFSALRISSLTLADDAVESGSFRLTAGQTQQVIEDQVQLARRLISGNVLGGIMSIGMLCLQTNLLAGNSQAVREAADDQPQAQLALLSNLLMITSAALESSGALHMLVRKDPWNLPPNVPGVSEYVHPLLRAGGVIAGVASIIDGLGMLVKAWVALGSENDVTAVWYAGAGITTAAGGLLAAYAAYFCQFALFGPAGLAALLIVAGAALAIEAERARSRPFEVWLRCCCFGKPEQRAEHDPVWHVTRLEDARAALMAYRAVMSGVTMELDYRDMLGESNGHEDLITLRVKLPGCTHSGSAWSLRLTAEGDDHRPLLIAHHNLPAAAETTLPYQPHHPWREQFKNNLTPHWEELALLLTGQCWIRSDRYPRATLSLAYWPDKNDPQGQIALTLTTED